MQLSSNLADEMISYDKQLWYLFVCHYKVNVHLNKLIDKVLFNFPCINTFKILKENVRKFQNCGEKVE